MMTDTPNDNNSTRVDEELERPTTDIIENNTGGTSSGRQTTKLSALRNFFRVSPSNKDAVTPRSGGVSARAGSADQQTSVSGEDDYDDHMVGSIYKRTDICKFCNFPRGSSVCCPVTRRHHGTDEEMTPSKQQARSHGHNSGANGGGGSSGGTGIMAKIRSKLPLTPGRRSNKHGSEEEEREDDEGHTPQTGELPPPLTLNANANPYGEGTADDGAAKDTPLIRNHTLGPLNDFEGENADGADANANLDAYASGDSALDAAAATSQTDVQYYCYTDENGDTYYYTQELQESVQDATQAPAHASHVEGEAPEGADGTGDLPEGAYVYQYVNENGETVNCICTPQADGESPAAQSGEAAEADRATPATSGVAHAGSDTANSSETDDSSANRKKSSSTFFNTIQNIFKPRRGSHADKNQHEDPLSMREAGTPATTPPSGAALDGTANGHAAATPGCVETHEYDDAVVAFMELLDANEKKKFLKERKSLIKELAASEKKERESIAKNRQDGMSAFTRDKLAASFAIRKDERVIKTGQKRSEPL